MKVTQEKLPASQLGLEIEVTPETSKKVYERVIQEFTRSTSIPGFRKGKVPRQVLVQRVGATRIKAAAVEELVEDSLKEALKQEKIDALGNFQLRSSFDDLVEQFEPGQSLTFSASVDVQPEVTLKQYTDLRLQVEEIKPDPDRVDQVLHNYQEQLATLIPVEDRPAQLKDVAVVDFKGTLPSDDPDQEPQEVPGGQAQDFQLELLEGRFIEGFIDGIIGMSPGETKEIQARFPESYPQPDVAGHLATFTVTLKELKEKELPELDNEFAQDASDGEFQTLSELRESLESRFNQEAEDKTKANQEQAVLDELLNQIEVDIPETLIEREVNYMLNQTALQLQNQGIDIKRLFNQDTVSRLKQQSRPDAVKRIKQTLALGEIAKRESIDVQAEELSTRVNELLSELADQDLDRNNIDQERLQNIVSEDLLKEKITNWLIEHATIELVPEGTLNKDEQDEAPEESLTDEEISTGAISSTEPPIDVAATVVEDVAVEDQASEENLIGEESTLDAPDPGGLVEADMMSDNTPVDEESTEHLSKKKKSIQFVSAAAKAEDVLPDDEPISSSEDASTETQTASKARKIPKKSKSSTADQ
ncbi:MAG: trigger factor [Leptolyngbyaceae cyanobacterium RU_5_1]|nr:trigger factor [Leptolyngbyaceae cyanobacterium RU_5_1]